MLIPLGLGDFDLAYVAHILNADQVVLLPAVPYGFRRSLVDPLDRLAVSPALLKRALRGVSRELFAQGFKKVAVLSEPSSTTQTGRSESASPIEETGGRSDQRGVFMAVPCQARPAPAWPADLARRVVVVSTGHTEQHGYHLPLCTDTLIVQAIADGLAARAPDEVWRLPAWPYGVSTHTREFPGTLNLGGRVFEDFFLAIVDRLARLGAETILFSNGHGGNHSFLVNVVKLAGERHPRRFIATEWLHTTGPALQRYRETALGGMGHGGELETSYILHLRPDLVHMDLATTETDFVTTANYAMDWVESGRLIANPPWSDDTTSGLYGDGRRGTAEKGRLWLDAAVEEKLESVREIREQHTLRQSQRAWRAATAGLGG